MDPEKLKTRLISEIPYLGSSTEGAAWAMKALHPAGVTGAIPGIPDRTGIPVAMTEFKSSYTVQNTADALLWDCNLLFLPSPLLFGTAMQRRAGINFAADYFLNTQLTGAGLAERLAFWHQQVSSARLAYYGVTISYDCAALSDNGTVTAAQSVLSWALVSSVNPATQTYSGVALDYPTLINMPLAIQYRAKEGVYMPMKLTNPALPFIDQSNDYSYRGWYTAPGPFPTSFTLPCLLDGEGLSVSFRNVSASTMLRITVRAGFEVTPAPGSSYSAFMHPSPLPDTQALDAYYIISAHLPDAFPDEYNDWNRLKGLISKVWSGLRPAIATAGNILAPGVGSLATGAVETLASTINKLVTTRATKRPPTRGNGGRPVTLTEQRISVPKRKKKRQQQARATQQTANVPGRSRIPVLIRKS